ncbi:hypothetical protein INT43_006361 [Umbelopsis isabellina]|uniref:Uncharacterized protein n=1 Tax=Mortierella isabellina TaxID=91625 RepID=A0A8H7Q052_MORIS|nr:hypothetical protein INT43_006361 [Umbelopsis isabellina]
MPKSARESKKVTTTPYKKGAPAKDQPKKSVIARKQMNKKGMKYRNDELTDHIDDLITVVNNNKPKKQAKTKDLAKEEQQVEEAQKNYEKLQTDMDDALAQITKL